MVDSVEIKWPPYKIFALLLLFFILGIALSSFIRFDFYRLENAFLLIFSLLIFSAFIELLLKNRSLIVIPWMLIFFVGGILVYSHYDRDMGQKITFGENVVVTGEIVKRPEIDSQKQKILVETNQISYPDAGKIENVKNYHILISAPRFPHFEYGDEVKISGMITEPGMIEGFDYKRALKKDQVLALIQSPGESVLINHGAGLKIKSVNILYSISNRIESSINGLLSEPQASLGAGLILGIKRNIPDDLTTDLKTTGLTHIVALSGYNVTIIVDVLTVILAGYFSRRKRFLISTILVILFVILSGAAASILRAAIFSLILIYGKTIGRQANKINLLLLTAAIILLLNPYALIYDLSFQLSFLAFFGLLFISPILNYLFDKSRLVNLTPFIKTTLIETLSAQLAVLPLILFEFGTLSIIAPVANILVLGVIPLAMGAVFVTSIAGLVSGILGKITLIVTWPVLTYIIKITGYMAKIPYAGVQLPAYYVSAVIILYAVFAVIIRKKIKTALRTTP